MKRFSSSNSFHEYVEGYGDFTAGSEWTTNTGWSTSGNVATKTGGTGNNYISKSIGVPFVSGRWYQAEFDLLSGNGASVLLVNRHISGMQKPYTGSATNVDVAFFEGPEAGKYYAIWKQSSLNTGIISLYSGQSVSLDNFKVYEINAFDRSVNSNPLIRHGTITKTAVATGADLVGYSGWSTSNYLEQPYNGDLDFGTGGYSIAVWVNRDAGSALRYVYCRGTADATETMRLGISNSGVYFDYGNGAAYTQTDITFPNDVWTHILCTVNAGGKGKVYVNGIEQTYSVNNVAPSPLMNAANYTSLIGRHYDNNNDYAFSGDIALLRISATVPTAEQIKKIYNDEKHLFQENAKATLYGTSDAVTALAYDDDTELLHAGTSAGRSVFQGLRRVKNTTDAVGSAISASNGLVAED